MAPFTICSSLPLARDKLLGAPTFVIFVYQFSIMRVKTQMYKHPLCWLWNSCCEWNTYLCEIEKLSFCHNNEMKLRFQIKSKVFNHRFECYKHRADSILAPSQWEMVLLCNGVSHCLGASLESAPQTGFEVTGSKPINFHDKCLTCFKKFSAFVRSHWLSLNQIPGSREQYEFNSLMLNNACMHQ